MSKSTKSQRKTRYQGTTITLEQYQLLYAYIRHDVTPSRRSLNNSAIPRPPRCSSTSREQVVNFSSLKRFKGIASRLEYRTTDDELVFKVGSRILLPNSRFNEVITEAHSSAGYKHLNLRCTIEKLAEKYALGSRQYGISEESVRSVIRTCHEGSCADKKRPGETVLKNLVSSSPKNLKRKRNKCSGSKEKSQNMQIDETVPTNNDSVSVLGQSMGKSETQYCLNQKESNTPKEQSLMQIMPMAPSVLKMQAFQNVCNPYPMVSQIRWLPTTNKSLPSHTGKVTGSNASLASAANMVQTNTYPLKIVQAGVRPVLPGQQIVLINSNGIPLTHSQFKAIIGFPEINTTEQTGLDLSVQTNNDKLTGKSVTSMTLQDHSSDVSDVPAIKPDINNNNINNKPENTLNNLDLSHIVSDIEPSTIQDFANCMDIDATGIESLSQVIAKSNPPNMSPDDGLKTDCDQNLVAKNSDEEARSLRQSNIPSMPLIPNRNIWYFYDDIASTTSAYMRMCMCITDMSLDKRKASVGCWKSVNRIRKKISYIQELISHQQDITKEYAELS